MAASIPAVHLARAERPAGVPAGPGQVVDRQGDLEDRVGVRLAVLAVHQVGELVEPAGEVPAEGREPRAAAVVAQRGPLPCCDAGPRHRLADRVRVVHREDADDRTRGRVGRLEGLGGGVPVDAAGGGVGDRVHLIDERHVAQVTRA